MLVCGPINLRSLNQFRRLYKWQRCFSVSVSSNKIITTDGCWKLHATVHRSAPVSKASESPILLISGWGGMANDWGAIPKLIASMTGKSVVTYDPRGLGQSRSIRHSNGIESTELKEQWTWQSMSQDAMDVIRGSLGVENFHVVGASMGGMIAQHLVSKFYEEEQNTTKIKSLTLISTALQIDREYLLSNNFLRSFDTWDDHDQDSKRHCAGRFFDALGDSFLLRPGRLKLKDKLIESFVESRPPGIKATMDQQRQLLLNFESPLLQNDALARKGIPVLVLHGKNDRIFHFREAFTLQDMFGSSCQVKLLDESEHLVWITDGPRIIQEIERFISAN